MNRNLVLACVAWVIALALPSLAGLQHRPAQELRWMLKKQQRANEKPQMNAALVGQLLRLGFTDDRDELRAYNYARATLGLSHPSYWFNVHLNQWEIPDEAEVSEQRLPYRDFQMEYPPGFFAVMLPFAALAQDSDGFSTLHRLGMGAVLSLTLLLSLMLISRLRLPITPARFVCWSALGVLTLGTVVTHRFDAVIALCIVAALLAAAHQKPWLLGAMLGLGVVIKLVPIILAPLFLVFLLTRAGWRDAGRAALAGAAVILVITLPAVAVASVSEVLGFLSYHSARPLQAEGTAAALLSALRFIAPDSARAVYAFGSVGVEGAFAPAAKTVSTALMIGGLLAIYALTALQLRATSDDHRQGRILVKAALTALVVFSAFGIAFSPQYLVWLLPIAFAFERRGLLWTVLFLTLCIYPFLGAWVSQATPWTGAIILARTGLLVIWGVMLWRSETQAE